MANAEEQPRTRFAQVVQALEQEPGVAHAKQGNQVFGHSALKVDDKIFGMVSSAGHFVVKLPKARVDALEASGVGKRFEASRGHPMKEWL